MKKELDDIKKVKDYMYPRPDRPCENCNEDIYTDVKYKPWDVGENVPGKKKPEEPKETPKNLDKPQQNPQDLNIK